MSPADNRVASRSRTREQKSGANIHVRVPQQTKQLIDSAASAVGKTLSEFVLDSARRDAINVLIDQQLFRSGRRQVRCLCKGAGSSASGRQGAKGVDAPPTAMAGIGGRPPSRGGMTAPTRLNSTHDISQFDCGNELLDDWLRNHAFNDEGQTARTYVVCNDNAVIGYYCISMGSVERKQLPSKLKRRQGLQIIFPSRSLDVLRAINPRVERVRQRLVKDALTRHRARSSSRLACRSC